ncbi:hypothetical protein [Sphingobacterium chuzhouense]|uniref:Uncharacterized protein n=1 Tax=Sphingobacterium chuzhouense TaxID=1742264 RepID=A0ABR7XT86_9SPHI|nr:hypothetical protein [Sphingobacterium chuzhouense]MBD1422358.1 hypothetical protein [Sphingobacterium chuzhouense]
MEEKLPGRPIRIIKSVEDKSLGVFSEELYKTCSDDGEAVLVLKKIERAFAADPDYELLHNLKEHASVSFRNIHTRQEVRFFPED